MKKMARKVIDWTKEAKNYVAAEVGYTLVGGSGCDKDNIQYCASDEGIIELVIEFLESKGKL